MGCSESELELTETQVPGADYRSGFEGSFAGIRTCSYGNLDDTASFSKIEDTLVVSVNWDSMDSIWINNWQIPINEEGFYSGFNEVSDYGSFIAEFRHDSLIVKTSESALHTGSVCKWETIRQR